MTTEIKNKARSILYILIISGLLSSTAIIIMLVWNYTLIHKLDTTSISFLEAVGIVSFVYVIYYGIRFGQESCHNDAKTDKEADDKYSSVNLSDNPTKISSELLSKLPDDDRMRFKLFVSKCCGMNDDNNKGRSSFGSKSSAKEI